MLRHSRRDVVRSGAEIGLGEAPADLVPARVPGGRVVRHLEVVNRLQRPCLRQEDVPQRRARHDDVLRRPALLGDLERPTGIGFGVLGENRRFRLFR